MTQPQAIPLRTVLLGKYNLIRRCTSAPDLKDGAEFLLSELPRSFRATVWFGLAVILRWNLLVKIGVLWDNKGILFHSAQEFCYERII